VTVRAFLGDLQAFVGALPVDQGRYQSRDRIAEHRAERRAHKRIKPAFQMYKDRQRITQPVQEERAGVGFRRGATLVLNSRVFYPMAGVKYAKLAIP